jgi:hypothetical protein
MEEVLIRRTRGIRPIVAAGHKQNAFHSLSTHSTETATNVIYLIYYIHSVAYRAYQGREDKTGSTGTATMVFNIDQIVIHRFLSSVEK